MTTLVLASTSRYRHDLLARLGLPFSVDRPDVDEIPQPGESPAALARRLAEAKARAVAIRHPGAWVIGSDQVADRDGEPLGKPGTMDAALQQLLASSGRTVRFHTAACLVNGDRKLAFEDVTDVAFRALERDEILRYLQAEQPLDCAGSFKCEGLGITLFESIQTRDPTALVGLPLIALAQALRAAGYRLP
ncbi:MAG: septum formation inhibitor Maf [Arenimonas sp.]|nr:septum formation inhibitor Maf [Arenimonas sp.]